MGFAKFKSRIAALEAKEILNGKKIDFERNLYLKCEMAKKNLHVKRTPDDVSVEYSSVSSTSFCSPYLPGQDADSLNLSFPSMSSSSVINRFNELDTSSLSLSQLPSLGTNSSNNSLPPIFRPRAYSAGASCYSSNSHPKNHLNLTINCNLNNDPARSSLNELLENDFDQTQSAASETLSKSNHSASANPAVNKAPGTPVLTPITAFFSGHSVPGGLVGGSNSSGTMSSAGFLVGSNSGFESALYHNLDPYANLNNHGVGGTIQNNEDFNQYAQSHQDKQMSMYCMNVPLYKKVKPVLSDQNNPPCNTLYVGNLPVNTSEEELRQIFSSCSGYKRLCFRLKPNHGPMCFVEFDAIEDASAAMDALYGIPLSNSIKGGIRLSYSKNPLGVRSVNNPTHHQCNNSALLMHHTSFM